MKNLGTLTAPGDIPTKEYIDSAILGVAVNAGLVVDLVVAGATMVIPFRSQHITVGVMEVESGGFIENNGILAVL